mmetsp:Transcript_84107/g.139150  ORF Transcript_84107/g.139150 Transcript_84107/m.139150 type:complete len:93 (+) Transcript_84107:384-662(+)
MNSLNHLPATSTMCKANSEDLLPGQEWQKLRKHPMHFQQGLFTRGARDAALSGRGRRGSSRRSHGSLSQGRARSARERRLRVAMECLALPEA